MGKINCFNLDGIYCWFWSQEYGHEPHFHAKKRGQWHFKVHFLRERNVMLERVKDLRGRISSTDANALKDKAQQYRAELYKEWEEKTVN